LFPIALERGIDADYVRSIIRMFRLAPPSADSEAWCWPLAVRTLGRFDVRANDLALEYSRKIPKKMLMLLKVLVALGPREVSEQTRADALWPDAEGDAAHRSLGITVLRLRRLLGEAGMIRQQGGKLSLDRSKCWVDAWAFEGRLSASANDRTERALPVERMTAALDLYRGAFLPGDEAEPWTVPPRERLRAKFVHALAALGRALEDAQRWEAAIEWYAKGLDCDAVAEDFYQGLMRCYRSLDRCGEAIRVYRRLEQTLSSSLGIEPSSSAQRLYRQMLAGRDGSRS